MLCNQYVEILKFKPGVTYSNRYALEGETTATDSHSNIIILIEPYRGYSEILEKPNAFLLADSAAGGRETKHTM